LLRIQAFLVKIKFLDASTKVAKSKFAAIFNLSKFQNAKLHARGVVGAIFGGQL
jgi:hypothetical protein